MIHENMDGEDGSRDIGFGWKDGIIYGVSVDLSIHWQDWMFYAVDGGTHGLDMVEADD